MEIHFDSWIRILEYCDYVQLHVLYCTCQFLSGLTEDFLRRRFLLHYKLPDDAESIPDQYNVYLIKILPLPALIYFQVINNKCLKGAVTSSVSTWIDDFYANFTYSLFDWYGEAKIENIINLSYEGYKGLQELLNWKNDRTDDKLESILKFLVSKSLIPHFRVYASNVVWINPDEKISDHTTDHLSSFLILSGRYNLLAKFSIDVEKLPKRSRCLELAIRSGNLTMINNVLSPEIPVTLDHVIAAFHTSDEMTKIILTFMPKILDKKENQSKIFKRLFNQLTEYSTFDRFLRFLPEYPTSEEVISVWLQSLCVHNTLNIDWLVQRKFLTNETAIKYLKPVLVKKIMHCGSEGDVITPELWEERMENCSCASHIMARLLRDKYGFIDMDLFPVKPVREENRPLYQIAENGRINFNMERMQRFVEEIVQNMGNNPVNEVREGDYPN